MSLMDLAGSHLAMFEVLRLRVSLTERERARYETLIKPFNTHLRAISREQPALPWDVLQRKIAVLPDGKAAIADWNRAVALASFPSEKRSLVRTLIARHHSEKKLVFARHAADAYTIARDSFVPAITADIKRAERESILEAFASSRVRCIVSARVLNEGLDVPDASVAIIAGGALGVREQIQRIGRVLRPSHGKRAVIYDLLTQETIDERRSDAKWRKLATQTASALHA
jgi:superfamily II DNA or RNA helicase